TARRRPGPTVAARRGRGRPRPTGDRRGALRSAKRPRRVPRIPGAGHPADCLLRGRSLRLPRAVPRRLPAGGRGGPARGGVRGPGARSDGGAGRGAPHRGHAGRLRDRGRAAAGRPGPPGHDGRGSPALRRGRPDARGVSSAARRRARDAGRAVRSIYVALIRHAPTAWNADGRVLGQADPPVSPEGAARATHWRLPADLQARARKERRGWAVSPRRRAVEPARLPGAASPVVEPRLVEQDWGEWTGRPRSAIAAETGRAGWDVAPPGGESPAAVLARVRGWLDGLAPGDGPDTWAAVTHMGVIRILIAAALHWDLDAPAPLRLLPERLHRVRRRGDGLLQLVGLNERLEP